MNGLKNLWIKITQLAEALDGVDDPKGNYILSLGRRVDKLERDLEQLHVTASATTHSLKQPGNGRELGVSLGGRPQTESRILAMPIRPCA